MNQFDDGGYVDTNSLFACLKRFAVWPSKKNGNDETLLKNRMGRVLDRFLGQEPGQSQY